MAEPQTSWTCSDVSSAAGEPLTGSASRTGVWLLIEYRGAWERKALQASAIPQVVKEFLTAAEKSIPYARVELIKQEKTRNQDGLAFFVAVSHDTDPALYRFDLQMVEDVLSLDLAAVVAGDARYRANHASGPMFIVCTNGRRDQCCARLGLPLAHVMAGKAPEAVWECTHLGGHRFAANVVVLPAGLSYGRVKASAAAAILDAGHIHLENFRGRTCFDAPAQAAEIFLRGHVGSRTAAGLSAVDLTETGHNRWMARFNLGGKAYSVQVERAPAGYGTYGSCGDEQLSDVLEFRLVDIA